MKRLIEQLNASEGSAAEQDPKLRQELRSVSQRAPAFIAHDLNISVLTAKLVIKAIAMYAEENDNWN